MKKLCLRLIALLLAAVMLTGCDLDALREDVFSFLRRTAKSEGTPFSEMTYTRPDMQRLEQTARDAQEAAKSLDLDGILDKIYVFYDEYHSFYTNYMLSDIHYCHDLTDEYWEGEYTFCREQTAAADAALEDLYYALAASPCRSRLEEPEYFGPGFFDSYEGDSPWDDALVELMTQESRIQASYYDLLSQTGDYDTASPEFYDQLGSEMVSLLVELIGLRQQIAQELGYDSYVQYAWDSRHTRDYAPGPNKYSTSFEVYLPTYHQPFIFLCPTSTTYDHLTFAHEFGHFCNDYATEGSYGGTDVVEFFSQGMEYLSLSGPDADQNLTRVKMMDSLSIYVEQAAYTAFEMEMYQLTGDALTEENLLALYDRTALAYGFDVPGYTPWEFVLITHIYDDPLYMISYVVSNDAAMQLYQMEQEAPGSGAGLYLEQLDADDAYFLAFLNKAGLQSPFAQGRIEKVRDTFSQILE